MQPNRLQRVEGLFAAALALPAAERSAFLGEQCADDPDLRAEVESLLAHASESIGMLDVPPVAAPLGATFNNQPAGAEPELPADKQIGSYRVLRFLGAGGMGVVYLAEQDRPRRTVALKLIRGSMASPSLLRRFEHEAEVLGRMHHPGIAQIYEAGVADTAAGPQPFLAMELVDGPPINDYAEARRLGAPERLELMARVCDAIHHAHQRGVIHRDLKPSNILVDAHGQPKILDFGVARAIDADIQLTTLRTSVGQLIGTLPYMSPEQIAADPAEIDNRADVYALGVLTFELLSGRLPYDLRSRSIPEAARIIRDEPPTRLSTVDRALRGDVETIVAKAMAKDKDERYQSAAALAEDLRRHLRGEPIAARDASAAELLRRNLRRYQGVVAAALIVILSLVLVAVYASVQSTRNRALALSEQSARQEEALARSQANELNRQLREELHAGNIERGRAEAVGNGPGAEAVLWPELFHDPDSRPARWALWELSARYPCRWTTLTEGEPIVAAASPDHSRIAAGTTTGEVYLLDTERGRLLASAAPTAPARATRVRAIAFADDHTVITAHLDGWLRRWTIHADSLTPLDETRPAPSGVAAAAFADDGPLLAIAHTDGQLSVWSVRDWTEAASLPEAGASIDAVALHAGSGQVAIAGHDGAITLWPYRSEDHTEELGRRAEWYRSLAFAPDGLSLYSAAHNGVVASWPLGADRTPRVRRNATDARSVAPDPSGRRVVSAHNLGLLVEDLPSGEVQAIGFPLHQFASAIWIGDAVLTAEPGGLRLWDPRLWPARQIVGAHLNWAFGAAFSPQGDKLASASGDGTIAVRSGPRWESLVTIRIPGGHRSRAAAFTRDGAHVAAGAGDGFVRLFDAATGAQLAQMGPLGSEVYCVAYSPDYSRLTAACLNGSLTVFDARSGEILGQATGLETGAYSAAYSPDGSLLYSSGSRQGVIVWDAETLRQRETIRTAQQPWAVATDPTGARLAVGGFDAEVEFIDLTTGVHTIGAGRHHLVVAGLAFSPDGATAASGGDDGSVKLWDPATGRLLATLEPGRGQVPGLAFHPDGKRLACTTAGGEVVVWDLTYHDRYTAANLDAAIQRFAGDATPRENLDRLRRWAQRVLE